MDHSAASAKIIHNYELRFRTMAEHIPMGMLLTTHEKESRIIAANSRISLMLGYSCPEDIIGKKLRDIIFTPDEMDDLAADIISQDSVRGRRFRMKQSDGTELWVSAQAWVVREPGGSEVFIEGFVEDITELIFFEQEMQYHETELNRYAHALTQANRKLNLLSSITRHDVLNKLTGLKGYVELMKMDFPDPHIQEYLGIQTGLLDSITQYTMFTKDYQDIGVSTPQWFDVKTTFETAAASLPMEGIPVVIETGNLWVYADPMLERVFYNLIENTLRHAGKLSRITVTMENGDGFARIIFADNGQGVPQEYKEAIFNRQYFKHTGFGLYLSREILEITGLTIRETGTPGKGARFEITVPENFFHIGDMPQ